jgi:hypothetical protein
MKTRNLLLMFLIYSCGNNVKLINNKLEDQSPLTSKQMIKKSGTLIRGEKDKILFEEKTYPVSKYSSNLYLNFIKTIEKGRNVDVLFTGNLIEGEMIIEYIDKNQPGPN